jgi:hypothetical protein
MVLLVFAGNEIARIIRTDPFDALENKTLSLWQREGARFCDVPALIFQISAGVGTLFTGCRGFIGPVPPPLWIRVWVLFRFTFTHSSRRFLFICFFVLNAGK